MFMIDCGEGTQLQLRRSSISFTSLQEVFISHPHGDHCFGLLGLISTFGLLGRTRALNIYAPAVMEELFKKEMEFYCNSYDYEVIFHPVDTTKQQMIFEDKSITVETIPLEHRVPCCGYLFREKPSLPHIRREMMDFYKIPISQVNNIKAGEDFVLPDGTVVENAKLTRPADPPRAYAYCSDTRYMPQLAEIVKEVNLLYHESTYADDKIDGAKKYFHSTARQAATVARDAEVKKLLIGHFSSRYNDDNLLLQQAQEVFPNTMLAEENKEFDVE